MKNSPEILKPQVAGVLYPSHAESLLKNLEDLCLENNLEKKLPGRPKALIIPHGGFLYSGSVMAKAFSLIKNLPEKDKYKIKKIVILAPAHQLSFSGIATHQADYFSTPLGLLKLDQKVITELFEVQELSYLDLAFAQEHTVEMVLPFIQYALDPQAISIIPLIIGECSSQSVLMLLNCLDGLELDNILIIISSDLSQYQPYQIAREQDEWTKTQILNLNGADISHDDACGDVSIRALLHYAQKKSWKCECLDLKNSGDLTGDKDKVVGYGAFYFY